MFALCTVTTVGRSEGSVLPVPQETTEPRDSATKTRDPGVSQGTAGDLCGLED